MPKNQNIDQNNAIPDGGATENSIDSLYLQQSNGIETICQTNQNIELIHNLISKTFQSEIKAISHNIDFIHREVNEPMTASVGVGAIPNLEVKVIGTQCPYHLTNDALVLLLCHEYGHLLGGAPLRLFFYNDMAFSVEGQADLFATQTCLPRILKQLPVKINEMDYLQSLILSLKPSIESRCQSVLLAENRSVCERSVLASYMFANYLYYGIDKPKDTTLQPPDLNFKDQSAVAMTLSSHPGYQCRLDTFLLGLDSYFDVISDSTFKRPSCWYH